MGTAIQLEVCGVSLDYSKNHIGEDHGFLFQEADRITDSTTQRKFVHFADHSEEEWLGEEAAAFIRPLSRVIVRLDLIGHTLESARAEYQALLDEQYVDPEEPKIDFMSFDEFCQFACRYPLADLDDEYISLDAEDHDDRVQGRFKAVADEIARIPKPDRDDSYWSEKASLPRRPAYLALTRCCRSLARTTRIRRPRWFGNTGLSLAPVGLRPRTLLPALTVDRSESPIRS